MLSEWQRIQASTAEPQEAESLHTLNSREMAGVGKRKTELRANVTQSLAGFGID